MSKGFSIKKYNKSLTGKIIITCLLACSAIFISLYISRITSRSILSTVDRLSRPNAKMQLVNDLFLDVVKLDQIQRNQALRTQPVQYTLFLNGSHHLQIMLDSLRTMSLQSNTEVQRIDSMKKILNDRDRLFIHYIKLHDALVKNDTLASQVKSISDLISKARLRIDNNVVTTSRETKTVIDTIQPETDKQTLWTRIFSKRKPQVKQVQKKIEEELKVRVDTMALGSSGDSLAEIGKAISQVEMNRIAHRNLLVNRRSELNRTGDILIDQLMSILNDLEADELVHAAQQNVTANHLVNKSIATISIVLIIFIISIIVLIFFIFTDIAKSNQYRKDLILAKEEAEEAGAVKQRFLSNMSHELRTPLQTILGISEQIRAVRQPRQQDTENIYQSSLHLLQIVNEVLDYSRIISGKFILEEKGFNLYRLLDEIKEMIQVQSARKGLSLNYDINIDKENNYTGDPFRLKQVLLNVLGNAVKFTSEGSVTLSVNESGLTDTQSQISFVVSDTGIGMTVEELDFIFNPFEQGGSLYKMQGTGLGLSIVKALIDIQNGNVQVQSEPGTGTTFTITIPYSKTKELVPEPVATSVVVGYDKHVWIVDDDLFILQLCDSILTKYGIDHTCFAHAQEALATPFPVDLGIVFLDIRMGEMDGITLCRKLKERNAPEHPRYIALTAQALPDEREAILKKGFDSLVMKPFLEKDFIGAINKYAVPPQQTSALSLDLSAIRKMIGDDDELLELTLQSFLSETEKDLATLAQSVQDNDSHGLAEALHKLAGRCGQVGITALSHRLRTVEIELRNGKSTDDIRQKIDVLHTDVCAVVTAVKASIHTGNVPT